MIHWGVSTRKQIACWRKLSRRTSSRHSSVSRLLFLMRVEKVIDLVCCLNVVLGTIKMSSKQFVVLYLWSADESIPNACLVNWTYFVSLKQIPNALCSPLGIWRHSMRTVWVIKVNHQNHAFAFCSLSHRDFSDMSCSMCSFMTRFCAAPVPYALLLKSPSRHLQRFRSM